MLLSAGSFHDIWLWIGRLRLPTSIAFKLIYRLMMQQRNNVTHILWTNARRYLVVATSWSTVAIRVRRCACNCSSATWVAPASGAGVACSWLYGEGLYGSRWENCTLDTMGLPRQNVSVYLEVFLQLCLSCRAMCDAPEGHLCIDMHAHIMPKHLPNIKEVWGGFTCCAILRHCMSALHIHQSTCQQVVKNNNNYKTAYDY